MPDGLYDQDVLLWAERQADLLRRLQAGERVNESIDWANLIEEVEDVGRAELHSCESLLRQAMAHLLKLALLPGSPDVRHWRAETVTFLGDAQDRYAPSMGQRIDLDRLYRRALRSVQQHDIAPARLGLLKLAACPFATSELVARDPDLDARLAAFVPTAPSPP